MGQNAVLKRFGPHWATITAFENDVFVYQVIIHSTIFYRHCNDELTDLIYAMIKKTNEEWPVRSMPAVGVESVKLSTAEDFVPNNLLKHHYNFQFDLERETMGNDLNGKCDIKFCSIIHIDTYCFSTLFMSQWVLSSNWN